MFVRMICKDRNEKEKNELYEIMGALCRREKIQIEEHGDQVIIYACPQGKIYVTEDEDSVTLYANTRHGGAGFHAFVVEFCKDIQEEIPADYDLLDDLEFSLDEDFHRLRHIYEDEMVYLKDVLLKKPDIREMNYLYNETYFMPMNKKDYILTPIGYLHIHDVETANEDELMDHFFVWNNWDKDARYYKNAALLTLAKEGVGKFVNMNETTIKYAHEICDYIELANSMDKNITLPVAVYNTLSDFLNREKMLKDPISMEEDICQYRDADVYHVFDDMRVVAHGASERSIDPIHHALCLMGPYAHDNEWNWMLMAGKESKICERLEDILRTQPTEFNDKTIFQSQWQEDGITVLEAVIKQRAQRLFIHAVIADTKDVPYIKACIKESGFLKQM